MKIKIIGKNSSNRMKLLKHIERVLDQESAKVKYELEILENDKYIKNYHIKNTPALLIDNKIVSEGKILTEREIKRFILVNE